ncbi:DNA replication ATP-dependent helicase Dna2 [Pseudohyphozyma bogoriensis]|nr:DNA replication ATP-dependent helicase Dna2 [Pseudohyphozyma bogoriensis]
MGAPEGEDAFMADLFAGLDAATFDTFPSSSPTTQRPSQAKPLASQPRAKPAAKPSPSHSTPAAKHPAKAPGAPPPLPSPFWNKSRGVNIKNEMARAEKMAKAGGTTVARGGMLAPKPASRTVDAQKKPAVRHVAIKVEGKENELDALTRFDPKGKGRARARSGDGEPPRKVKRVEIEVKPEPVDVDAMLEGFEWDEELKLSQDSPVKKLVKTVLTVRLKDAKDLVEVVLADDWTQTQVDYGDTVNLIGPLSPTSTPALTIDRLTGLIILHPDILVSSTKVADSSHCARKALLQEIIRVTGGSTPSLVYGNMLHELMQACLSEGKWDEEWRREKIKEILKRGVMELWSIELEVDVALEMMVEKSKGFEAFRDLFVGQKPSSAAFINDSRATNASRARLAITKTIDIEEDIWSPKFGLKGKVDVSVSGKIAEGPLASEERTIPFEIKTGKSTAAGSEHRAQTMLYTLLMSDRYDEDVDSGLLYYSTTNEVFRIKPARNEIRGLLIARNEFATYLHRRTTLSTSLFPKFEDDEEEIAVPPSTLEREEAALPLLPPPIDEPRSCKWCYAVDGDECINEDEADPLQMMFDDKTGHLTETHLKFFKDWERLISLEEQELVRFKKEIWTMGAEERQKFGRCLANMSIDESFEPPAVSKVGARIHQFTYRLQHAHPLASQATMSQRVSRSLLGGSISVNDPIVISIEHPTVFAISRGFVLSISAHHIVVGLDHSLTESPQALRVNPGAAPSDFVFRIDKDELAAGMGRIRDNVIQLFTANGDERRRRLVVDLEPPKFIPVASNSKLIPSNLNEDQLQAVQKVLSAKDYALILGMPGTGKTTTIAHVLKALAKAGKSVLLTSYTHSAVDNILLKVADSDLSILRLGNRDKILPSLHRFTLDPENKGLTLAQVDKQLMTPQIVATTCLSINEPIFTRRHFDVCILDEASQVTLPTCLGPLRFADTFILVGDHNQLPPLVRNRAAREGGLDVSLFKRLSDAHPDSVVYLSHQYRMNDDIMLLSNKLIYDNRLQAGSEQVAKRTLRLPNLEGLDELHDEDSHPSGETCWIETLLSDDRKVVFVDTDLLPARERKSGSLIDNEVEAKLVYQTVNALIKCGVPETEVGVIALYRHQIKLLARKLEPYSSVEVLTADKSQGRDKDCIVMSLTRSNTDKQTGDLLKDWRRINVCLTRAKSKLIVFGSRSTLGSVDILAKFFEVVEEQGWIYALPAGAEREHGDDGGGLTPFKSQKGGVKRKRVVGPAEVAMSSPLARDVVNSM